MLGYYYKAGILIASFTAILIAEVPLPIDDYTKFGVCGSLVFIIWLLIGKHADAIREIGSKMDGIRDAVTESSERQCDVLREVLVQDKKQP